MSDEFVVDNEGNKVYMKDFPALSDSEKIGVLEARVRELQNEVYSLKKSHEALNNIVVNLTMCVEAGGIQTW